MFPLAVFRKSPSVLRRACAIFAFMLLYASYGVKTFVSNSGFEITYSGGGGAGEGMNERHEESTW